MEGYSLLYNKLFEALDSMPFVNIVTEGLSDEIDLSKQTIFPLAHIVINTATPIDNAVTFNVTIYAMDIVDISDDGRNNKVDVMNTQYNVLLRLYEQLRRGNLWSDKIEVETFSMIAFEQAYENFFDGWQSNMKLVIPNHMTIC